MLFLRDHGAPPVHARTPVLDTVLTVVTKATHPKKSNLDCELGPNPDETAMRGACGAADTVPVQSSTACKEVGL